MKINNESLLSIGVDPSLFSNIEINKIEKYANELKSGTLPEELFPNTHNIIERYNKEKIISDQNYIIAIQKLKDIKEKASEIIDICNTRRNIFGVPYNEIAKKEIIFISAQAINDINNICNSALDQILLIYSSNASLSNITNNYSIALSEIYFIFLASKIINLKSSSIEDKHIKAHLEFESLTKYCSSIYDKAVILQNIIENEIREAVSNLITSLDLDNDGGFPNILNAIGVCQKIVNFVSNITI